MKRIKAWWGKHGFAAWCIFWSGAHIVYGLLTHEGLAYLDGWICEGGLPELSNLETLCKTCHLEAHGNYISAESKERFRP